MLEAIKLFAKILILALLIMIVMHGFVVLIMQPIFDRVLKRLKRKRIAREQADTSIEIRTEIRALIKKLQDDQWADDERAYAAARLGIEELRDSEREEVTAALIATLCNTRAPVGTRASAAGALSGMGGGRIQSILVLTAHDTNENMYVRGACGLALRKLRKEPDEIMLLIQNTLPLLPDILHQGLCEWFITALAHYPNNADEIISFLREQISNNPSIPDKIRDRAKKTTAALQKIAA